MVGTRRFWPRYTIIPCGDSGSRHDDPCRQRSSVERRRGDVAGPGRRHVTHGERLPAEIERAWIRQGVTIRDVELLAVASGPGAFTGLRIGLAADPGAGDGAEGASNRRLRAGRARVATWPRIYDPRPATLWAWMDAQRGEVFASKYRARREGTDDWSPGEPPSSTNLRDSWHRLGRASRRGSRSSATVR